MRGSPWLRILVIQQLRGFWVARGLEHDISIEHRSLDLAIEAVVGIVRAHCAFDRRHGRAVLSTVPAAPRWCWTTFGQATPLRLLPAPDIPIEEGVEPHIAVSIAPDGWAIGWPATPVLEAGATRIPAA